MLGDGNFDVLISNECLGGYLSCRKVAGTTILTPGIKEISHRSMIFSRQDIVKVKGS